MSIHIHLAIVSDQLLANLIPALTERPDKALLLCSRQMQEKGLDKRLRKQLEKHGIAADILPDVPSGDIASIRNFGWKLAGRLEEDYPDAQFTFNATGGSKQMVLGLIVALEAVCSRIIYADTARRVIEVVSENGQENPPAIPMISVLNLPDYLAVQGFRLRESACADAAWAERAQLRKSAAKHLGLNAEKLGPLIGNLNRGVSTIVDSKTNELTRPCFTLDATSKLWAEALSALQEANLLTWDRAAGEIHLPSSEAAAFLRGGWLEEYVWHIVKDAQPYDCCISAKGIWEGASSNKTTNEFDVLACHLNQLLFIECKTLSFNGENDSDIAYKVESLGKDTRGIFGESWIISAREPGEIIQDRARIAGVRLLGPADLPKLRQHVIQWKEGATS